MVLKIPLYPGDRVKVVVDSQFDDRDVRRVGQEGVVVAIDHSDEWAYQIAFGNKKNWFKRYILQKI